MNKGGARLARFLLCLGALQVLPALAQETSPHFSLDGFGTLGMTRTTSDEADFVRDLSQPAGAGRRWDGRVDSLLGVQAGMQVSPQWQAVVQAVSRYRYDRSFRPEISWAFVKYEPTSQVAFRAGRMGTEFFMLSDSRMVGYSYLPVRPPGDFFWFLPFSSIDGADVVLKQPVGDSVLVGKLFYGISHERMPFSDRLWNLSGSPLGGGYVEYQSAAWTLRASYANITFNQNLPIDDQLVAALGPVGGAQASAHLATRHRGADFFSLGAIYEDGPWQVQAMHNHIEQSSNVFQSSRAGYVLAGYRMGAVTPYLGHSWVYSDRRGNTLNAVVAKAMDDSHAHQNTTFAGVRWDALRNVAFKAQWDHIQGEAASIFPYRWETPAWNGKMDVFSVNMDFIF